MDAPVMSAAAAASAAAVDAAVAAAAADSMALATAGSYLPASAGFSLPLPPDPVRFPRAPINLKLAVMLLRSTYETVEGMQFTPMDQFQIKFWKLRQAEWEPYTLQYAPLKIEQGKLEVGAGSIQVALCSSLPRTSILVAPKLAY